MQDNIHVVIMAGGSGQRFWPWSTKAIPKQFHDFLDAQETLLQATADRYRDIVRPEHIWIVTQDKYADTVKKQLPWIDEQQILAEPVSKNTAPCIAYACSKISRHNSEATLIITPADHTIKNKELFINLIQQALHFDGFPLAITLLGVPCKDPATGYGYIAYNKEEKGPVKSITHFVEKPSKEQAEVYIKHGNYVWNTGIFIGKVGAFIKNFQAYLPKLWNDFEKEDAFSNLNTKEARLHLAELYKSLPSISFDQAILEKAAQLYVVFQDFEWTDLGAWDTLYEHLNNKAKGANVCQGQVVTLQTTNCLIKGNDQQLIATYGLDNLVIVQHQGVVLICPRDEVQNLKILLKKLEEEGYEKYL